MERQYFSYGSDAKFKIEEILGEYCFDFDFESIAQKYLHYDKHNGFYLDIPDDDSFWTTVQEFDLDNLESREEIQEYHAQSFWNDRLVWTPDYDLISFDYLWQFFDQEIIESLDGNYSFATGTGRHDFLIAYCEAYEDKYDTPFDVWTCW